MNEKDMQYNVAGLLPGRKGHFHLESGHHGDTWLDLAQLAARLVKHEIEAVCGPLVEGAFVALMIAASGWQSSTTSSTRARLFAEHVRT